MGSIRNSLYVSSVDKQLKKSEGTNYRNLLKITKNIDLNVNNDKPASQKFRPNRDTFFTHNEIFSKKTWIL